MDISNETLFPTASKDLIKALKDQDAQRQASAGEVRQAEQAVNTPENAAQNASTDPLKTAKPLKDISDNGTPPPPPANLLITAAEDLNAEPQMIPDDTDLPDAPPPNKPGRMGTCGTTGQRRLPDNDEFIDDKGYVMPHGFWRAPKQPPKRRKLATLGSLADIQRELAKLYADYHHLRINAAQYTRGVYGLSQLATVMRMANKTVAESEGAAAQA